MSVTPKRESSPDVVRLRALIDILVEIVRECGGEAKAQAAKLATARRASISMSELDGVLINAVADGKLEHSLRSDRVWIPVGQS